MKFGEAKVALEAVKVYLEAEEGPIWHLWEDGHLGNFDPEPLDWPSTIGVLERTNDDLSDTAFLVVTLYRLVVDTLAGDQGASRRATHEIHTWDEEDPHQICTDCNQPQYEENDDCQEIDCKICGGPLEVEPVCLT